MRTTKNGLRGLMLRSMALLLLLLGAVLPARGRDYIISYTYNTTTYYIGMDGNNIAVKTTVDPSCIWTCRNGNNDANLGGTSYSLRNKNNNTYYLTTTCTRSGSWWSGYSYSWSAITVQTSASNIWRSSNATNGNVYAYNSDYSRSASIGNGGNALVMTDDNTSGSQNYRVTNYSTTAEADNLTVPTISITGNTSNTVTFSHTDLSGSYRPAYTQYTFSNNTHYWYNNDDHNSAPTAVNANTLNPTYTWSLTDNGGGVASINAYTGVLTLDGAPTGNITVRLTVSNISPIANKTVDFTLTRTHYDENVSTVATMSAVTLTPTSKTMEYGDDQEFTASATVTTTTTTTQAYDRLQNGGNTYYYYDGALHNSTPTPEEEVTHPDPTYSWTLTGAGAGSLSLSSPSGSSTTVTFSSGAAANSSATLTVTASTPGASDKTNSAAITINRTMPTAISSTTTELTLCVGTNTPITYLLAPMGCYNNVTVTSSNSSVATGSTPNTDGTVTVTTGSTTGTATLTLTAAAGVSCALTVTVQDYTTTPTITFNNSNNQVTIASAGADHIYYTTDGSTPTEASNEYTEPFVQSSPATLKAIATKDDYCPSEVASYNLEQVATPTIEISGTSVTFDGAGPSASYYYTTNGDEPTTALTAWDGNAITGITDGATIKVIAAEAGKIASPTVTKTYHPGSGTDGTVVTLNDLEDHSWAYYSDPDCPIRSLSPADVKITYYGDGIVMTGNADYTAGMATSNYVLPGNANYVGGAKVNVGGEDENTFVYYKTLERGANTTTAWTFSSGNQSSAASRCPYTTIPNPFQVRPTYGERNVDANNFTGWRGFQCWRLKSVSGGAVYSAASGGTALAVGAVIDAETDIYFAPNSEYDMAVELEAVWARAYLIKGNQSDANTILSQNVGVERNFMTLTTNENYRFNGTSGRYITNVGYPVTISCYYPSGEAPDNTNGVVTGNNSNITLGANTKFENVTLNVGGNYISANGYDLFIGRGCTVTANTIQGLSSNSTTSFRMRIESGSCNNLYFMGASSLTSGVLTSVLGSDYDRAKNDNSKIRVTNDILVSNQGYIGSNTNVGADAFYCIAKSGDYYLTSDNPGGGYQFYLSSPQSNRTYGKRTLVIEGGRFSDIAGGLDMAASTTMAAISNLMVDIRIKGGQMDGAVYGAAQYSNAAGNRRFVITGGNFTGWIAGGANGTQNTGGRMAGASYIYVGGNANVNSNSSSTLMNRAVGGNVFGAGCGYSGTSTSGQVTEGTTVVVADDAYVERGVYGGGSYGYTTNTSNVYILGGHVEGKNGGVNGTTYSANIAGGVYGGACQNQGGTVNITMTGGLVEGGLYGGSNATGTISNNVTMQIDGGQVGTPSQHANIHGGGLGQATRVSRNVELTLGSGCDATDGVTVYGDVYGGSALGYVNGTSATNTYHTYVTLYKGTIYGGLYGGGLGNSTVAANVYGPVQVKVYGGSVRPNDGTGENGSGGVFGCNNVNGTPAGTVTVDLYGTDPAEAGQTFALYAVYGGGNRSNYTGTPVVTIHGCDNNIEYVYGGGNASDVAGTNVTIWGGHIGNAFGGGNGFSTTNNHTNASADHYNPGANITTGGTHLTIHGGQIDAAFGGSNQYGTINGGITVTVVEGVESGNDPCSGTAYAACTTNTIEELYGGGNQAPAQTSGGDFITPSVTISSCDMEITNLFGGAKAADHGADINLVITKGKFQNVFGGNNLGGTITGNVTLTLKGGTMINAFGGNNQGGSITGTITVTVDSTGTDCPLKVENVYGGGNEAAYEPTDNTITSPVVNIVNGTVRNAVFGGGLGAAAGVTANPQVTIGGTGSKHAIVGGRLIDDSDNGIGNVYGGGSQADVLSTSADNGNTHVILTGNARVKGNVYGGGNQADVEGNTKVEMR